MNCCDGHWYFSTVPKTGGSRTTKIGDIKTTVGFEDWPVTNVPELVPIEFVPKRIVFWVFGMLLRQKDSRLNIFPTKQTVV